MDYLKTRELYHAFGDWGKRHKKNPISYIPVVDRKGVLQEPAYDELIKSNTVSSGIYARPKSGAVGKADMSGIGSDQPMLDENSKFASKLSAERKEVRSRNEWIAKSAECTTRINTLTARRDTNPGAKSATFNPVIVAMRNAKGHCDEMAKSYADDINARTKADLEASRAKVARLNQVGEANVNRKLAEEKKKRRQDTIRKFFRHSAMSTNDYTAVSELYHSKFKYIDKYKSKAGNWVYIYEDAKGKVDNFVDTAITGDKYKRDYKDAGIEFDNQRKNIWGPNAKPEAAYNGSNELKKLHEAREKQDKAEANYYNKSLAGRTEKAVSTAKKIGSDISYEADWQARNAKKAISSTAKNTGYAISDAHDFVKTFVNEKVTGSDYKRIAKYHENEAKYHKESHDFDKSRSKMFTEFAKEKGNNHADVDRKWAAKEATSASQHGYLSTQHKKAAEKAKDDYLNKSLAGKATTTTRKVRQKFDKNYTENYNEWRDRVTKSKSKYSLKSSRYYDEYRDKETKRIRVK